jgi:hypothetical protein
MLSAKHAPQRNIKDVADPVQVKTLTAADLLRIIEKSGDSIAAICKETDIQPASAPKQAKTN